MMMTYKCMTALRTKACCATCWSKRETGQGREVDHVVNGPRLEGVQYLAQIHAVRERGAELGVAVAWHSDAQHLLEPRCRVAPEVRQLVRVAEAAPQGDSSPAAAAKPLQAGSHRRQRIIGEAPRVLLRATEVRWSNSLRR